MPIGKPDSLDVGTPGWKIQVADVAPVMRYGEGEVVQQTRDGVPRWLVTLLVQRPGENLEQLDLKPYAQAKPDFSPGDAVRFVGDSVIVHHWGMVQGGQRARSGFWFEGEIEAV